MIICKPLRKWATEAVSDTKETSLALAAYALLGAGISYQNVHQIIMNIRRSRYAMLEDLFVGSDDEAGLRRTQQHQPLCLYSTRGRPCRRAGTLMSCPCSI